MPYTIICHDKSNQLDVRKKSRDDHLKYLETFKKKIILAGPLLNKKGLPTGSVIILDLDSETDVKKFIKNDPYKLAGLFKKTEVLKFKKVF